MDCNGCCLFGVVELCGNFFAKLIFTLYTSVSFIVKCVNFAFEKTKVFRRNNLFFIRQSFFFSMHINLFFDALTSAFFFVDVDDDFLLTMTFVVSCCEDRILIIYFLSGNLFFDAY